MPIPTNLAKRSLRVAHASLSKWSAESDYRVHCPVCPNGLLFVRRDDVTFSLIREDLCVSCGQRVFYTDHALAGEPLPNPKEN